MPVPKDNVFHQLIKFSCGVFVEKQVLDIFFQYLIYDELALMLLYENQRGN